MATVKEAWEKLFGIPMFSEVGPIEDIKAAARELMLAVHVDACGLTNSGDDWRQCGEDGVAYCERAKALQDG